MACSSVVLCKIQQEVSINTISGNNVDPDQMPYSEAYELGLVCSCLSVPILRVNTVNTVSCSQKTGPRLQNFFHAQFS